MINVKTFVNNPLEENTYIISDASRQAVIIDCGALTATERETISNYVQQESLQPVLFLLTHAHFDHIFGAQWVYDNFDLSPAMLDSELPLYRKGYLQIQEMFGTHLQFPVPPPGKMLSDGDRLVFGHQTALHVIATPGHTPGGCCYYIEDTFPLVFTGDSLFKGGIGRTDFPGGSAETLKHSLESRILKLPTTTTVYPGHGASTTVNAERDRVFP